MAMYAPEAIILSTWSITSRRWKISIEVDQDTPIYIDGSLMSDVDFMYAYKILYETKKWYTKHE